ncbi:T9SS type A sorting domain-containing protein [Marinilongibacter aquaticus]|uniref:T9SS type A sorting domain-containing protein n=1 Tax=Marinilongibacter aquaticus TaxID=2975157 RepID=UPI0021BD638F|nr:T9SS type A sorting domain-containing protein [Marinilongibacter aquaticus]UBM57761.1 T9SS type A sorting domain-containing protein [Marinilongibacter aquaticus]
MKKTLLFLQLILSHFLFAQEQVSFISGQNGGSFPVSVGEFEGKGVFLTSGDIVNGDVWLTDGTNEGTQKLCSLSDDGSVMAVLPQEEGNARVVGDKLFIKVADSLNLHMGIVNLVSGDVEYLDIPNFEVYSLKSGSALIVEMVEDGSSPFGEFMSSLSVYDDNEGLVKLEMPKDAEGMVPNYGNKGQVIFNVSEYDYEQGAEVLKAIYTYDGLEWKVLNLEDDQAQNVTYIQSWEDQFLLVCLNKLLLCDSTGKLEEVWKSETNGVYYESFDLEGDFAYFVYLNRWGEKNNKCIELDLNTKSVREVGFDNDLGLRFPYSFEMKAYMGHVFFLASSTGNETMHYLWDVNFDTGLGQFKLNTQNKDMHAYYEYKMASLGPYLFFVSYDPESEYSTYRHLISYDIRNSQVEEYPVFAHSGFTYGKQDRLYMGLSERDDNFEPYVLSQESGKVAYELLKDLNDRAQVVLNGTKLNQKYLFAQVNGAVGGDYLYQMDQAGEVSKINFPLNQGFYKYLSMSFPHSPQWGEGRAAAYMENGERVLFSDGFQNLLLMDGNSVTRVGSLSYFNWFPSVEKTKDACTVEINSEAGPQWGIFSISSKNWVGEMWPVESKGYASSPVFHALESAFFVEDLVNEKYYLVNEKDGRKEEIEIGGNAQVVERRVYFKNNNELYVLDSAHNFEPQRLETFANAENYELKFLENGFILASNTVEINQPQYLIKSGKSWQIQAKSFSGYGASTFKVEDAFYINLGLSNYFLDSNLNDLLELDIENRIVGAMAAEVGKDLIFIGEGDGPYQGAVSADFRNRSSGELSEIWRKEGISGLRFSDDFLTTYLNNGSEIGTLAYYESGELKEQSISELGLNISGVDFIAHDKLVYFTDFNPQFYDLKSGEAYSLLGEEYLHNGQWLLSLRYDKNFGFEPFLMDLETGEGKFYDINKGKGSSFAYNFFEMGGAFYCTASSKGEHFQLWKLEKDGQIEDVLGLNEQEMAIFIYPNPTYNSFKYDLPEGVTASYIWIYDLNGREIKGIEIENSNTVDLGELSTGTYIIKVKSSQGLLVRRISKL